MIQNSAVREQETLPPTPTHQSNSAMDQVCHYIEENPTSSVLIGLGVGFGAGLALGGLLRGSAQYFKPDPSFAERLSQQMADSLAEVLPKNWRNSFRS